MNRECIVIMPFDFDLSEIYRSTIKPALEQGGLKCRRIDELPDPTHITSDIVNFIDGAGIIVADLTRSNPNVFYELAVAHSLNKPTVMITQSVNDVPFDLQSYRVLTYLPTAEGLIDLRERLQVMASSHIDGKLRATNPVVDNLAKSPIKVTVTTDAILQIEMDAEERVWVLAPDIELGPRYFVDVMRYNIIDKGISYKYLISEDEEVLNNLTELIQILELGDAANLFECRSINQHMIESDVTIIDPNTAHEHAFILAPCESPYYHFRVMGSHLFRVKARFRELWKMGSEINGLQC